MNSQSTLQTAEKLNDQLLQAAEPLQQAAKNAYRTAREEGCQMISGASERIRQNPVPVVVGAVAFGIAVGCLIMSGRHTPTFQERYVDEPVAQVTDTINTTLARLYETLKFW